MAEPDTTVIIIGAGSTGLLLAQGLRSAGIPFRIFERHSEDYESREWSMSLHWGGEFLSKVLSPELYERQHEIDVDPHYDGSNDAGFVQCNGATAEVILVMPGHMPRRVSRRKLKAFMSEGIKIEYGKRLDSIEKLSDGDRVTAQFEDGSSVTGKLLVGCDGSNSRVREIILGDKKVSETTSTPYSLYNFPCSYPADVSKSLRDIHPVFKVAYHPKLNMMFLLTVIDAASKDPAEWKHQLLLSWAGAPQAKDLKTPQLNLARLKEMSSEWAHPWSTAMANIPDGTRIWVDSTSQWDPRPFFKAENGKSSWNGNDWLGLTTLAGDSAHTMLPHRGQGLNNSLEDASRLLTALTSVFKDGRADLRSAIAEYETEMVARGGGEVETTARQAKGAHNWEMLMQSPMFKHGANKTK